MKLEDFLLLALVVVTFVWASLAYHANRADIQELKARVQALEMEGGE